MSSLDMYLRHNTLLMWLERRGIYHGVTFPGATFPLQRIAERKMQKFEGKREGTQEDLLDKFLRAKDERPNIVSDREVLGSSLSMMIAGAETRSVSLSRHVFMFLEINNII